MLQMIVVPDLMCTMVPDVAWLLQTVKDVIHSFSLDPGAATSSVSAVVVAVFRPLNR